MDERREIVREGDLEYAHLEKRFEGSVAFGVRRSAAILRAGGFVQGGRSEAVIPCQDRLKTRKIVVAPYALGDQSLGRKQNGDLLRRRGL